MTRSRMFAQVNATASVIASAVKRRTGLCSENAITVVSSARVALAHPGFLFYGRDRLW